MVFSASSVFNRDCGTPLVHVSENILFDFIFLILLGHLRSGTPWVSS